MVHNTVTLGSDVVVAKVGVSSAILSTFDIYSNPSSIAWAYDDDLEANSDPR